MDGARRTHPLSWNVEEWAAWLSEAGAPRYRAMQLFQWLHQKGVVDPERMTNIDKKTRARLLEAGLGWIVKLDKPEFVGKAALVAAREQGLTRKLVGFEMTGRGIARHGYPLTDHQGEIIGVCTSGGPSPTLGKNIGLGYVETRLSEPGSSISVDCRGKAVPAVVVRTPFYRRPR